MKIKKWLIGLATILGLFFISSTVNINASRLPNRLCNQWTTNHVAGNTDHIKLTLHHYSGTYNDYSGDIHIHMSHFKLRRHGWYTYKCYTYPMPFKYINKNTLKMQNGTNYYIYLHRVTVKQIERTKHAHQRAVKLAKIKHAKFIAKGKLDIARDKKELSQELNVQREDEDSPLGSGDQLYVNQCQHQLSSDEAYYGMK